jgi:elongation factor Ts
MGNNMELVKNLRQECGAGVQDCHLALEECGQDYTRALHLLREKMAGEAEKISDRKTTQGWLETYTHANGRLAVVVEINTETDFAAQSPAVRALGHEIALQIAACNPIHVREEDIPVETLLEISQRTVSEALAASKPENVKQAMVDGRLRKYIAQNALLHQTYIKDEDITISQLIARISARVGENIQVRRFIRWEMESAKPPDHLR